MARKPRDHAAEYARQKAKAQAAEYRSQREYKRARKISGVKRSQPAPPKRNLSNRQIGDVVREKEITRFKRESRIWSKKHSWVDNSKFDPNNDWNDDRIRRYYAAYKTPVPLGLSRRERKAWKMDRLHDFLVPDFITEEQWKQLYLGV